jgi:GNAT superfamily N-acetyltransferase
MCWTKKSDLIFMSAYPVYQRHAFGTLLLNNVCDDLDEPGLSCFVMALPAARKLYPHIGFEPVRDIRTIERDFSSMARPSEASR